MSEKPTSSVRVRFAPSPTGFMHIGGLRMVLYNFLFAQKHRGQFILRIEDTDQKRFVEGALENILEILKQFGLSYDEGPLLLQEMETNAPGRLSVNYPGIYEQGSVGPYIQSERLDIYRDYATRLVKTNYAYYCFCTESYLNEMRRKQMDSKQPTRYDGTCRHLEPSVIEHYLEERVPFVVRLKIPQDRSGVTFQDDIRGTITIQANEFDDFVILKSDGFPTYHFASVVDDHLMEISHVLRGEEWLPSTPKHILLYEAFGWELPHFAHLPLLLNPDKTKLSKRKGDKSVDGYLERGYLKEALLNFVAFLGWHPGKGSTEEFFTLAELEEKFDLSHVNKAGAVFDTQKLDWFNRHYIMEKSVEELLELVKERKFLERKEFYHKASVDMKTDEYLKRVLAVEQDRLTTLYDIGEMNPFFFQEVITFSPELLIWKKNSREETINALQGAHLTLSPLTGEQWTREHLSRVLLEKAGDKRGDFLWPLRVALTGVERSPSPMDVAWVLGKDRTLERLKRAFALLGQSREQFSS